MNDIIEAGWKFAELIHQERNTLLLERGEQDRSESSTTEASMINSLGSLHDMLVIKLARLSRLQSLEEAPDSAEPEVIESDDTEVEEEDPVASYKRPGSLALQYDASAPVSRVVWMRMQELDLDQEALAKRSGLSQSTIERLLEGITTTPRGATLRSLEDGLDLDHGVLDRWTNGDE